jgi:hypothetical protein
MWMCPVMSVQSFNAIGQGPIPEYSPKGKDIANGNPVIQAGYVEPEKLEGVRNIPIVQINKAGVRSVLTPSATRARGIRFLSNATPA